MQPWSIEILEILIIAALVTALLVTAVRMFRRKGKSRKKLRVMLALESAALLAAGLFVCSHRTYYRYNDWLILDCNIHMVRERYGEFDLCMGDLDKDTPGTAAYYIYTDNSPILPDHLPHYYYMHYDEWGVVDAVWEGLAPGG